MIINAALSVLLEVLGALFALIRFLPIPDAALSVFASGLAYIGQGLKFIAAYTHFSYLISLLVFVAAIDAAMLTYKIIMWAIRKIPFWSVK